MTSSSTPQKFQCFWLFWWWYTGDSNDGDNDQIDDDDEGGGDGDGDDDDGDVMWKKVKDREAESSLFGFMIRYTHI